LEQREVRFIVHLERDRNEDLRYSTLGNSGIIRRTYYALARTLTTRDDPGRWGFDWSEVGGNAAEGTLSNEYYPTAGRVGRTVQNWGVQIEYATNNLAKEFWPDPALQPRKLDLSIKSTQSREGGRIRRTPPSVLLPLAALVE
jgi:hypothetical protein